MNAPDDHGRYTIANRGEIVALLERMRVERTLVTVTLDDGRAYVSHVLDVRGGDGTLVVDVADDAKLNAALFESFRLAFAAELDRVQIAFDATRAMQVALSDGPAASVPLPSTIVRLQRREWYRVRLPESRVVCTVVDEEGRRAKARAVDLSCGGIGVVVDQSATVTAIGAGHEIILSLPDGGPFVLDATVSCVLPMDAPEPGDPVRMRLGYRFDRVPPKTEMEIQRFVTKVEVGRVRR